MREKGFRGQGYSTGKRDLVEKWETKSNEPHPNRFFRSLCSVERQYGLV